MKHREIDFTQENLLEIMERLGKSNDKEEIIVLLEEEALPVADKVLERFKTVQLDHKKVKK